MASLVSFTWYSSLLVITVYYLFIFRVRKTRSQSKWDALPAVSIVIAVKNGTEKLRNTLLALVRQDYPQYEIVVVDDYSKPQELHALEQMLHTIKTVSLFRSDRPPGKNHAFKMGVEKANHAIILCTDDDCLPAGQNWIKSMVAHAGEGNVVLGYSPYFQKAGRLNLFIRFETIMTGMQYLSWAMLGSAFMGVGRNMLFPKSVFLQNQLHQKAREVVYGDDDLFVQSIKGKVSVKVSLDPDSFIYTEPPETFKEYMKQKHRHLSAGHYYSLSAWLQPGIFGIGIILHWLFLIPMLWCNVNITFGIAFFAGILIRWIVYATWTNRLGDPTMKWLYSGHEMVYSIYLAIMGMATIFTERKTWN